MILAEKKILQRINELITKKSKQYGWTAVEGVAELFRLRGCCSSKSLIRQVYLIFHFYRIHYGLFIRLRVAITLNDSIDISSQIVDSIQLCHMLPPFENGSFTLNSYRFWYQITQKKIRKLLSIQIRMFSKFKK